MKLYIFVFLLLLSVEIISQTKFIIEKPKEDEITKYSLIGDVVAKKLLVSLKTELMRGIKEGGPVSSLKICNLKAIPLTNESIASLNKIVSIKRTSFKFRNAANKPNDLESKVLNYFEENWNNAPDNYVQKYSLNDSTYFNYYQPLKIGGLCTTCHGPESEIKSDVMKVIKDLYPDDKATGYKIGDFRGLIRVTFKED